jgi:UDP-N-acetyl-D-glucosamine dehydrogenase
MIEISETIAKFKNHRARIGLIGLGYAGLPLALSFAESGFSVCGFDIDSAKTNSLAAGKSYISHIPAERIGNLVSGGRLVATSDFSELSRCDTAIICVPTPLAEGNAPDLTYVVNTAREVKRYLHRGQLVVLESTTYPGTTDEVLLGILRETGLTVGEHYYLAFSPEREDPANPNFNTRTIPKVVGGVTPNCLKVAAAAYSEVVDRVVEVSSARVAESAKLLENIYRCVNIAMVNELKLLFERMNINVWEVIQAASTKPFGFTPFYPGPGLGGHCIPIDPFYLTWKARQYNCVTRFIELAGEINTSMPNYVVQRLADGLNLQGKALRDSEILILGVAYKRNVDDVRESPALKIIELLEGKLAHVSYHDPHVPRLISRHLKREMQSVPVTRETLRRADAIVIVTDHTAIDYTQVLHEARLIVDTRNVMPEVPECANKVITA